MFQALKRKWALDNQSLKLTALTAKLYDRDNGRADGGMNPGASARHMRLWINIKIWISGKYYERKNDSTVKNWSLPLSKPVCILCLFRD